MYSTNPQWHIFGEHPKFTNPWILHSFVFRPTHPQVEPDQNKNLNYLKETYRLDMQECCTDCIHNYFQDKSTLRWKAADCCNCDIDTGSRCHKLDCKNPSCPKYPNCHLGKKKNFNEVILYNNTHGSFA